MKVVVRLVSLLACLVLTVASLATMPSAIADDPASASPTAPVANPDDFRQSILMHSPGKYVLPITANDTDPNGLPLSVASCPSTVNYAGAPGLKISITDGVATLKVLDRAHYGYELSFKCTVTNGTETSQPTLVTVKVSLPKKVKVTQPTGRPTRLKFTNPNPDKYVRVYVGVQFDSGRYSVGSCKLLAGASCTLRTNEHENDLTVYFSSAVWYYQSERVYARIRH